MYQKLDIAGSTCYHIGEMQVIATADHEHNGS